MITPFANIGSGLTNRKYRGNAPSSDVNVRRCWYNPGKVYSFTLRRDVPIMTVCSVFMLRQLHDNIISQTYMSSYEITGPQWLKGTKENSMINYCTWSLVPHQLILTSLMFSLICAWTNGWVKNQYANDLRRHRAHYEVTVMTKCQ